jgi:hypothetical protein
MANQNLFFNLDPSSIQDLFDLAILNNYDPLNPREVQYLDIEFVDGIVSLPFNELDMVCICTGPLQIFLICHEGKYLMVVEVIGILDPGTTITAELEKILTDLKLQLPQTEETLSKTVSWREVVSKVVLKPGLKDTNWSEITLADES